MASTDRARGLMRQLREGEILYSCSSLEEAIERLKAIELMHPGSTYTLTKCHGTRAAGRFEPVRRRWGPFRFTRMGWLEQEVEEVWWEILERRA